MDLLFWQYILLVGTIWLVTLAISIFVGWGFTSLILRWARVEGPQEEIPTSDGHARLLSQIDNDRPVLRGGLWIGVLERIAVASAIMTGMPQLISVVIAVKGLGRYPELKNNPAASECFIIGTGASFLTAVAIGAGATFALEVLPSVFGLR